MSGKYHPQALQTMAQQVLMAKLAEPKKYRAFMHLLCERTGDSWDRCEARTLALAMGVPT